ncbi:MAG: histidinol-phosphate transaminase [Cyclobacteriaceae bacterium]
MTQFNRRQWLKTAGLTGTLAFVSGYETLKATPGGAVNKPKANNLIRLSSNENPYGPSAKVREAITKGFDIACRYPQSFSQGLVAKIAEKEGVTAEHVVITGGSTEGLNVTGLVYAKDGGEIVAGEPTFLAMLSYAKKFGAYVHMVPVNNKQQHDLEAMSKRVTSKTNIIYLCNPANPTSTIVDGNELRDFCRSLADDAIIFSDEAYFDYIEEPEYPSMLELVKEDLNVIVCRTFSKVYGLAGMRLGYMIARPDIARRLRDHVPAYTNILAIEAAKAAMDDLDFYKYSLDQNMAGKKLIYSTLDELGLKYVKSSTNFVFFESGREIKELQAAMKEKGVLIGRPFPPLTKWCRISTGKLEEVEAFTKALKQVI